VKKKLDHNKIGEIKLSPATQRTGDTKIPTPIPTPIPTANDLTPISSTPATLPILDQVSTTITSNQPVATEQGSSSSKTESNPVTTEGNQEITVGNQVTTVGNPVTTVGNPVTTETSTTVTTDTTTVPVTNSNKTPLITGAQETT